VQTQEVAAPGHSYGDWTQTKAPTCTEKGEESRTCSACKDVQKQEVAATGHTYTSVVTAPTCTERGYTTHTCSVCGYVYEDAFVTATGHSYGQWYQVTAPTEEREGQERRDCANCDAYETRVLTTKTVASIRMAVQPTNRTYIGKKDALDVTGGKILVTYTDGTTAQVDLTADMVTGFNNALAGNQTLTVTYYGKSTSYNVSVTTLTVTFLNWDGSKLSEQEYMYGDTVTVPADPTKAADKTYTYAFAGWDKKVAACTEEAVYTATYTPTYIEYTVTFRDEDGTALSTKTYHYGDKVTAPADPTKAADKTYTYTFTGWDQTVTTCAGNATITAVYQKNYIDYTVIFQYADGTVISKKTYHYGDQVTVPADPEPQEEGYSFSGWDKAVTDCTGNATYTARFASDQVIGDFTGDEIITNRDVEYLLWNILFPSEFPVEGPADFDADGKVTNKDAEYLLWHILFPTDYPLTNAAVVTYTDVLPADKKYLSEVN